MEQEKYSAQPWPEYTQEPPQLYTLTRRDGWFGLAILLTGLALSNFCIFGGLNLGFSLAGLVSLSITVMYLRLCGKKLRGYPLALMILSAVILCGFARSADGFVKFVLLCFLLTAGNVSLALLAGRNRRDPAGVCSLLDAPMVLFSFGFGRLPAAARGVRAGLKSGGAGVKKISAVLLGAAIAVPILAVMIWLLISADVAFAGLMERLPAFDFGELLATVLFGVLCGGVLFARAVALTREETAPPAARNGKKLHPLTVNTVLAGVCGVYAVYLFSQLAYFVGGFSGILPEGFTMAQYARRGFFEMAWLCAINLGLIALAVGLVDRAEKTPLLTRLLCLFVGVITAFFVVTASAKMAMYIGAYGLTRLRVLTEVIMLFLGFAAAAVCLWLFVPKLPYMKVLMLAALIMGALVLWVDVDTLVAAYNVRAVQAGWLNVVDVEYLTSLSSGAVPYIAQLAEAGDPTARHYIQENTHSLIGWQADWADLRSWNLADWLAGKIWQ